MILSVGSHRDGFGWDIRTGPDLGPPNPQGPANLTTNGLHNTFKDYVNLALDFGGDVT